METNTERAEVLVGEVCTHCASYVAEIKVGTEKLCGNCRRVPGDVREKTREITRRQAEIIRQADAEAKKRHAEVLRELNRGEASDAPAKQVEGKTVLQEASK